MKYALYRFSLFLGFRLPLPLAYFVAQRFSLIRHMFSASLRFVLRKNLEVVLRYKAAREGTVFEPAELSRMVKQAYLNFGRYITDFVRIPFLTIDDCRRNITFSGIHVLDETIAGNKGAIGLTAHIGNWELAGVVAQMMGYHITAVAFPQKDPRVAKIFRQRRECKGMKAPFTGTPKELIRALHRNEILALVGDRLYTDKGIEVTFFGRLTLLPRGPYALSIKTGAPLFAGFLLIRNTGYHYQFEKIPAPPAGLPEEQKIRLLAQEGAGVLERIILDHPDQWLNFSVVWPKT